MVEPVIYDHRTKITDFPYISRPPLFYDQTHESQKLS